MSGNNLCSQKPYDFWNNTKIKRQCRYSTTNISRQTNIQKPPLKWKKIQNIGGLATGIACEVTLRIIYLKAFIYVSFENSIDFLLIEWETEHSVGDSINGALSILNDLLVNINARDGNLQSTYGREARMAHYCFHIIK